MNEEEAITDGMRRINEDVKRFCADKKAAAQATTEVTTLLCWLIRLLLVREYRASGDLSFLPKSQA